MPHAQSALVAALVQLSDANRTVRHRFEQSNELLDNALSMVSEGMSPTEALRVLPILATQQAADASVAALFEARHHVRKVAVCEALRDGMSIEELATIFDVRPDLVASYAAEGSNTFLTAAGA